MSLQTIIVTGAASGIGLACTRDLLDEGHNVTALDLSEADLKDAYPTPLDQLLLAAGDVSEAKDGQRAVADTVNKFGRLDALIHFAGVHGTQTMDQLDGESFTRILHVNVTGSFLMAQAASKPMIEQGRGSIVLTASANFNVGGVGGAMGQGGPAYTSSKGAVVGLTRSLARGLGSHGIRVNAVSPGATSTPMTEKYSDEGRQWVVGQTLLGRMAEPKDISDVARFLVTDAAGYMTGEIVNVNGGIVLV